MTASTYRLCQSMIATRYSPDRELRSVVRADVVGVARYHSCKEVALGFSTELW